MLHLNISSEAQERAGPIRLPDFETQLNLGKQEAFNIFEREISFGKAAT